MTLKEGHRGSFGGLRSEGFLRFGVSLYMKDFFPTPTFGYGMYLDIYGQVYEKSLLTNQYIYWNVVDVVWCSIFFFPRFQFVI